MTIGTGETVETVELEDQEELKRLEEERDARKVERLNQIEKNKVRFYKYKELLENVKGIELIGYNEVERRSFKNILVKLNKYWPYSRELTLDILQKENAQLRKDIEEIKELIKK